MQNRLIDATASLTTMRGASDQLAITGGESLSMVWWIGAGLLVVGVAIGLIAALKRRNSASSQPADDSLEGKIIPPTASHHEDESE